MTSCVISVEHLSKQYDLGVIGTGTISRDLNRWWARLRKQPDPYTRIGQKDAFERIGESILALDDISFQVEQGEALGIIGRNGAGKSTLLKILSRVTAPTSGVVKVKGRIGSLLEVGTGFHPELTGRENVYLNGAILGMKKAEVASKFDEIVAFSGVEKFIDTPVKRYSSGMYVRLAFAVAAHLDPDILIVDEVLAVGDAEFQKKCLGKMEDVAGEGRTVLFVSHNMQAIQNLCSRTLVMETGDLRFVGPTTDAVSLYLQNSLRSKTTTSWVAEEAPGNEFIRLLKAWIQRPSKGDNEHVFRTNDALEVCVEFENLMAGDNVLDLTIHLQDERNILVFVTGSGVQGSRLLSMGKYRATCIIPGDLLNQGTYTISRLLFVRNRGQVVFEHHDTLTFEIIMPQASQFGWMGRKEGVVRPLLDWSLSEIE